MFIALRNVKNTRTLRILKTKCPSIYLFSPIRKLTAHREEIFGTEMITNFKISPSENLMITLKAKSKDPLTRICSS